MIDRFAGEFAFLSNFYPCRVDFDGVVYDTVEHAYQAAKTNNLDERQMVARMRTPGAAKRVGRILTLRRDWEIERFAVMRDLLCQKFSDCDLAEKLSATWPRDLIEGNDWGDQFWGVSRGIGENHLGRLLMEIRIGPDILI